MAQPLASTCLSSYTYDDKSQTLTLAFKKVGAWEYSNVPQMVASSLLAAASKGTFFEPAAGG